MTYLKTGVNKEHFGLSIHFYSNCSYPSFNLNNKHYIISNSGILVEWFPDKQIDTENWSNVEHEG